MRNPWRQQERVRLAVKEAYQCMLCRADYATQDELNRHLAAAHTNRDTVEDR